MAYGCNDPLRFARQAEAEAIMKGYMMPGTGLNGCNSLFWNPYMTPCNNYANFAPYVAPAGVPVGAPVGTTTPAQATPQGSVMPNSMPTQQGVNAAGDSFVKATGADQVDDGKISFGQKLKSFGKGIISPVTNMFKSPGNFIKGALGIAAGVGLIAVTGGAAAPIMVAAGVGLGGVQIVKGAAGAMSAKTDAEAQKAWENMGSGTFAVAGSIAGAKAAVKASGGNTTGMSALKATKECFKTGFSKTNLTKAWTTAKTNITGFFKGKGTGAASGNIEAEPKVEPAKKNNLGDTPEEIIDTAKKQLDDGANYGEVKKAATRNQTHADKKAIKENLTEVRNEKLASVKKSETIVKKDTNEIKKTLSTSKKLKQKANKAQDEKDVSAIKEVAEANNTQRKAKLAEINKEHLEQNKKLGQGSKENGGLTHKQKKLERTMENKSAEAAKNEAKAIEKAEAKKVEAEQIAERKAECKKEWEKHQTAESKAKMEANAKKTSEKAKKRQDDIFADKRTLGIMERLKYASKSKLEKIFAKPSSKFEEAAAYQLLLQA